MTDSAAVRAHIQRLLAEHPTLRVRFLRSLLITLHSKGVVSLEEVQRQADESVIAGNNHTTPGDDNVPLATRLDEAQRRRVQELTIGYAAEHLSIAEIDDVLNITRKRDEAMNLEEIANLSTVSFGLLRDPARSEPVTAVRGDVGTRRPDQADHQRTARIRGHCQALPGDPRLRRHRRSHHRPG
jgi:hypothetical protein